MIKIPFRSSHTDDEGLSRFIDGTCTERERIEITEHLEGCDRCFEAYREAVLYKGLWVSGASDLESSKESIELARGAVARRAGPRAIDAGRNRGRFASLAGGHLRAIAAAASVVLIVSLGISYHFARTGDVHRVDQGHILPIREAVERASMNGLLVIPGGEGSLGTAAEHYRSGYVRINDSLRSALAYFSGEFQGDEASRAVVYWLLGGYIATGQVNAASDLASQALEDFPGDTDMMLFDAIVSYMEDDFNASERTFRSILAREPDNPYASLNLAVLLSERGDGPGALALLHRVASEHAGSPFAARAKQIENELSR